MKIYARLIFWPIFILASCHTLLTGSPIPLWHIERLENPVQVKAATADCLILQDGRRISLPNMKVIPPNHAVFLQAMKSGVEIQADGEVIGLLNLRPICGNDPVVYRKVRINLSDLAGVLNPSGLDPSLLVPEEIEIFQNSSGDVPEKIRVDALLLLRMRRLRKQIDYSKEQMGNRRAGDVSPLFPEKPEIDISGSPNSKTKLRIENARQSSSGGTAP